jgi:hypothetical protein
MQHHGGVRSPFVDCDELSFIEDAPFHSPQQFILAKTPWCTKLCVPDAEAVPIALHGGG